MSSPKAQEIYSYVRLQITKIYTMSLNKYIKEKTKIKGRKEKAKKRNN